MKTKCDTGIDTATYWKRFTSMENFSLLMERVLPHSTLKIPLGSLFLKGFVSELMGLPGRIFSDQSIDMSDSLDLKIKQNK